MSDIPVGKIRVGDSASKWGPFSFDFSGATPPGDSLQGVVVTSMLFEEDVENAILDSTSALICPETGISGAQVQVFFQYPGISFAGKHRLDFTLTFLSGAVQSFKFDYVYVEN